MKSRTPTKTVGHYVISDARALDGDTIEAVIHLPFGQFTRQRIRLKGWWAPEMRGEHAAAGRCAQVQLKGFLESATCSIFCRSERTDRYGRVIAELWANHKPVAPSSVLGVWEISAEEHKRQHDALKANVGRINGVPVGTVFIGDLSKVTVCEHCGGELDNSGHCWDCHGKPPYRETVSV